MTRWRFLLRWQNDKGNIIRVGAYCIVLYDDELRWTLQNACFLKLREFGMDLNVTAEVLDKSLTVHAESIRRTRRTPCGSFRHTYLEGLFLRDFDVDEEKLLQHAEELSFYYDKRPRADDPASPFAGDASYASRNGYPPGHRE